jgi:uncharacterized protein YbcC (UPF0753/DUF2309 family)
MERRRMYLVKSLAESKVYVELQSLPPIAMQSILEMTQSMGSNALEIMEYLLFIMPGWSGYFRKNNWHEPLEENSDLTGFMAILVFLHKNMPDLFPLKEENISANFQERMENLRKKEAEYRTSLLKKIKEKQTKNANNSSKKPKVRFLFCIDVRSESMRRHLESNSEEIETDGFAGFFGMPVGYKYWTKEEFSHVPAIIQPGYIFEDKKEDSERNILQTKSWVQKIKRTFPLGFQYVEGAGFLSAFGLLSKTFKLGTNHREHRKLSDLNVQQAVGSLSAEVQNSIALGVLKSWIQKATQDNLKEKQMSLGLDPTKAVARSKDWAEVFPEAGLAGCAAFIIGRREITTGLDLKARTFLNSYNYKKDPELKTLELLLTAPVVVGSWINLQYFASTVCPEKFGAGNKLSHSIAGNIGVLEGNSWNLKTGLPLQSVYDGEKFIHQPIRLQVIVESPLENVKEILSRHESIRNLVQGEWIKMIVIDPSGECYQFPNQEWCSL